MGRRGRRSEGFTLIEAAIAVALVGVLATLASTSYSLYVAQARRTEARIALGVLYDQQEAYKTRFGQYASDFDALGFAMSGGERLSATAIQAKTYEYQISQPWGPQSWYCSATGNIDGDGWLDVIVAEKGAPYPEE